MTGMLSVKRLVNELVEGAKVNYKKRVKRRRYWFNNFKYTIHWKSRNMKNNISRNLWRFWNHYDFYQMEK